MNNCKNETGDGNRRRRRLICSMSRFHFDFIITTTIIIITISEESCVSTFPLVLFSQIGNRRVALSVWARARARIHSTPSNWHIYFFSSWGIWNWQWHWRMKRKWFKRLLFDYWNWDSCDIYRFVYHCFLFASVCVCCCELFRGPGICGLTVWEHWKLIKPRRRWRMKSITFIELIVSARWWWARAFRRMNGLDISGGDVATTKTPALAISVRR